jgi:hypothetical protein
MLEALDRGTLPPLTTSVRQLPVGKTGSIGNGSALSIAYPPHWD